MLWSFKGLTLAVALLMAPAAFAQPVGTWGRSLVPEHRAPAQVWDEMRAVQAELELAADEERMDEVADRAHDLNTLKGELYDSVVYYMDLDTREQARDPDRVQDMAKLVEFKRSLNFIWVSTIDVTKAANSGAPGNVRNQLEHLVRNMGMVQSKIPSEFLTDSQAEIESEGEGS